MFLRGRCDAIAGSLREGKCTVCTVENTKGKGNLYIYRLGCKNGNSLGSVMPCQLGERGRQGNETAYQRERQGGTEVPIFSVALCFTQN